MHPAIAQHRSGISAICQRYRIRRLEVFGSAARAVDFNPASSDADFLVEFAPDAQPPFSVPRPIWNSCWVVVLIW
jgi:predicted nucleotidyltransferase